MRHPIEERVPPAALQAGPKHGTLGLKTSELVMSSYLS